MSLEVTIRLLRPDDLDAVVAIDEKITGPGTRGFNIPDWTIVSATESTSQAYVDIYDRTHTLFNLIFWQNGFRIITFGKS